MNTPTTAERIAKTLWNNGMLRAAFQDAAAGLIAIELEREQQQIRETAERPVSEAAIECTKLLMADVWQFYHAKTRTEAFGHIALRVQAAIDKEKAALERERQQIREAFELAMSWGKNGIDYMDAESRKKLDAALALLAPPIQ